MEKLDLTFREGDRVRTPDGHHGEVLFLNEDKTVRVRWKTGLKYTDPFAQADFKTDAVKFACHNYGAPFERVTLDEEGNERKGYLSGLEWGLRGQKYQAGGPMTFDASHSRCRHWNQQCDFLEKNNKAFRKGWKAGQERANMKKQIDFKKPLRLAGNFSKAVEFMGALDVEGEIHNIVKIDGIAGNCFGGVQVDDFGLVSGDDYRGHHLIVENVPPEIVRYIEVPGHADTDAAVFLTPGVGRRRKRIKVRLDGDGNVLEVGVA